jgi:hypothetical protein
MQHGNLVKKRELPLIEHQAFAVFVTTDFAVPTTGSNRLSIFESGFYKSPIFEVPMLLQFAATAYRVIADIVISYSYS